MHLRVVIATLLPLPFAAILAQGVTTAGIRGRIGTDFARQTDFRVRVSHDATGFAVEVRASNGGFLVQGLEPGGPYTVTARAFGFVAQRRARIFLTLGELREINFALEPIAAHLDTVKVVDRGFSNPGAHADGGTGTTISASLLDHLPTLNRDLYDFLRLVPQVSTKISLPSRGLSGGGVGFRFNDFLINGVSERTLSGGVSGAFAGGKSIPLDAVQEYQVLLAPYDVRYGDFAGALVNAVTKSGTNTVRGSVFAYGRNDRLARRSDDAVTPYDRAQYGVSLSGPIRRDRLHFFIATELQRFTFPAAGPYVGQPQSAERPVPVALADLNRFDAVMRRYGLTAGSAGPVDNGNPLRNVFTRFDLMLPAWNSRVIAWNNYSGSEDIAFSRAARDTFSLSSYQVRRVTLARTTAMHVHTTLRRAGGGHNELLVSKRVDASDIAGSVQQPIVRVSAPGISGGRITLNSGTHESGQAIWVRPSAWTIKENLTLPLKKTHVITVGADVERFRIRRGGAIGSFGAWSFASLDALEQGLPDRYEVRVDIGENGTELTGTQYAGHAGDQWQASDHLSVTFGMRADALAINERAPYHAVVDSVFNRRTDEMPRPRIELSPRVAFIWDPSGTADGRLRGGLGIFSTRYPLAWAQTALSSYGVGGVLRCNALAAGRQPPPAFAPNYRAAPTACAGGASITTAHRGDVDLLDPRLRMMRVARASLAYDRRLPWSLTLVNEGLFTRALSDFVVMNLNLRDPENADVNGRTMYGTINSIGIATPKTRSPFSEVIELRNTARNHSLQLSTKLERPSSDGMGGFVSYTYSRARDVQTPLRVNTRGTTLWASARVTSGRHDDLAPGTSSNDVPHRIVAAGTLVIPRARWGTELSFYYVGESGRPFTYTAFGTLGRGDLNADGSNANDPVYVPRNALDASEILVSGVSESFGADNSTNAQAEREQAQRNALEAIIQRTPCLRRQRGRILERNSCREPWSNTTILSIRQTIPVAMRAFELQLDVSNVLNLLNAAWGLRREAAPALLEHVGQAADSVASSRPVFRFNDTDVGWTTVPGESAFQLQLAMRYRF